MKKQLTRLLTVLLCVLSLAALCFGMAACGEEEDTPNNPNPNTPETPETYSVTLEFNAAQGSVTLAPAAEEYEKGAKVTVTVTAKEGYEIETFTVSTDAAAALTEGKYELTVTADAAIKATFKTAEVAVTGVTLTAETLTLEVGGKAEDATAMLTATVEPENATDKAVTWTSSEPTVAAVEGGKVTALAAGEATITASAGGKSASCTVTVTQHVHAAKDETYQIDGTKHYQLCECGARVNEAEHAHDGEPFGEKAGHYYKCVCGYTFQMEEHVHESETCEEFDYNGHSYYCDICDYKITEGHEWQIGTPDEEGEHRICTKCGYDWRFARHVLKMISNQNGTHHQECQNSGCNYKTETVPCEMEWTPLENKAEGHTGVCKTEGCGYTVASEPHDTNGEDGACSKCGYKDYGPHIHEDKPDANGYYDGLCDEEGAQLDEPVWTFSGGVITKYNGTYAKVKIPETIDGVPVTELGASAFSKNTEITDVIIPECITTLGIGTFSGCSALYSAVILAQEDVLPQNFLENCVALKVIVISTHVTSTHSAVFGNARSLVALDAIYYLGDKEAFTAIQWGKNAKVKVDEAKAIYYYSTESTDDGWHWEVEGVLPKPWKPEP